MTRWYDIFLWIWMGSIVVGACCLSILGIRKVGLFGTMWSPGWIEEFDPGDLKILKCAGYALLAGFACLALYAVIYIILPL